MAIKPITIYAGSSGQQNRVSPERVSFDGESGFTALQSSENTFIDPSGMVQALRGTSLENSGDWHSLTIGKERGIEVGYAIKERPDLGSALVVRIDTDGDELVLAIVGEGLQLGRAMSWAWAGDEGGWKVFFTNGIDYGWIDGREIYQGWPVTENNPDPDTTDDYRQLGEFFRSSPPLLLGWSGYRMFFTYQDGDNHCLGVTMHGSYGLWRRRDWLQWPDRIIMYAPTRDGHYVGTTTRIYFIPSLNISAETLSEFVVADYPPLEGGRSAQPVDPEFFGIESNAPSYITATAQGPVLLLPGGFLVNLINKNLKIPAFSKAGVGIFQDSLLIQSNEA